MPPPNEMLTSEPISLDSLTACISNEIHGLMRNVKFAPENIWSPEIIAHRVCIAVEKYLNLVPDREHEPIDTREILVFGRSESSITQLREAYHAAAKHYYDRVYGTEDAERLLWAIDGVCRTVHGEVRPGGEAKDPEGARTPKRCKSPCAESAGEVIVTGKLASEGMPPWNEWIDPRGEPWAQEAGRRAR